MSIALLLLLQAGLPTVGDTIWIERTVTLPAGADVRPGEWLPEGDIGLLGRPIVQRAGGEATIRYPAVAWRTGTHTVVVPGPVIVLPDGRTDSLPPESRTLQVLSVLPADTAPERLAVQPEAGLVSQRITEPWPLVAFLLLATLLFLPIRWWWRRRGPPMPAMVPSAGPTALPLDAWSEAGESRAVAAIAHRVLRLAMLGQLPGVPAGLVDSRLVRIMEEQRPQWPVPELATVLRALEVAQFSETGQGESLALATRAMDLAQRITTPAGGVR
ncbi:MAG: hypothetical protein ABI587_07835 [Gemmatimonadales bacterium]